MDSTISLNKGSPAHFDDSGYGSVFRGQVVLKDTHSSLDFYPSRSFTFTCAAYSRSNGVAKRPMISSVETIRKRLFVSSPYSPEGRSWQNSPENGSTPSPVGGMKQRVISKVTEDLKDFTFSSRTKELPPKCPASPMVKFFYSPLKNSKLFRAPTPSPQKSTTAETREAPSAKSWGASINLPEQRCDVLKKLANRNVTAGLSTIMSYMSDEDVFHMSCVSRMWKRIVMSSSEAWSKRERFRLKRLTCKENKELAKEDVVRGNVTDGDRELLLDVTNRVFPKQPLSSNAPVAKSDCFFQVAKSIPKTEVILKCPMCQYPAKCLMRNKYSCTRDLCSYAFCRKCLGSHAHSHSCPVLQDIPKIAVGSKRSKRNLRRL